MNSIGKWVLVLLATMIILSSAGVANAQPSEVWVDDDFCNGCPNDGHTWGFDAFAKIQDGIGAVASPGTIHVAPGTYVENINFFGKAITVNSEEGPEVTIIDGNQADSAVTFTSGEGPTSVINGFTIQNGRSGFDTPGFGDGGGIRITGSSPTITSNVVTNNLACTGAGIAIRSGSPIIQDNIITNNTQSGCSGGLGGGGISIVGSNAQILDNIISNNFMGSADGGGISLFAAGTPTIKGNIISGNTATGLIPCASGGGISMVNHSDALIVQNLIIGNNAGCGGGISWLVPNGERGPLLINNTIVDNNSNQGSAIFADGFDARTELINNILVAKADQTAILCGDFNDQNPPILRFNDIFSPQGTAYGGICADQTGINGNISADPMFVDFENGDYHLQAGSPCIDTGQNEGAPTEDMEGNPRPIDGDGDGVGVVDMGAFEFRIEVCNDGVDNDGDGLADCDDPDCVNDPICCDSTGYAKGISSIRFRREQKDMASLRMCVDQAFCNALKAGTEEIVLELDDCNPLTISGERLKSNRSKTRFRASSVRGEMPKYTLTIDCRMGWLKLRLQDTDLKGCVSNPVKTCVSIKNGPCLCAEEGFEERRDRKGTLKKLFLRGTRVCQP